MLTALLKLVRIRPSSDQVVGFETSGLSTTRQDGSVAPTFWQRRSPIDLALMAAFVTLGLGVVLPNSAILNSKQYSVNLIQVAAHSALNTFRTVDPKGRPALFLMALFCGWYVGAMVLWPEEGRNASLTSVQKEILALCQRLANAQVMRDELTLASMLHDQFTFTNEHGETMDRAQFLTLSRIFDAESQKLSTEPPRVTGSRAFVEGSATVLPRSAGAEPLTYEFSTCFVKTNGKWQAIEQRFYTPVQRLNESVSGQRVAA